MSLDRDLKPFPCNSCGKCCENVSLSEITQPLDRGDGTCYHFDINTKRCLIYDERPNICRVEFQYQKNYSHLHTWDEFITLNLEVCDLLQS